MILYLWSPQKPEKNNPSPGKKESDTINLETLFGHFTRMLGKIDRKLTAKTKAHYF